MAWTLLPKVAVQCPSRLLNNVHCTLSFGFQSNFPQLQFYTTSTSLHRVMSVGKLLVRRDGKGERSEGLSWFLAKVCFFLKQNCIHHFTKLTFAVIKKDSKVLKLSARTSVGRRIFFEVLT